MTDDTPAATAEEAAQPANPRRRRNLFVGLAVTVTLSLVTAGSIAAFAHQQNVAEEARLAAIAAEDAYQAEQLAEAVADAQQIARDAALIVDVAEGADLDADAGAELIALIEAAQTVEGDRAAVRAATYDTVRAVNTVVRLVLAQARETTAAVRLAADSDKEALADALDALVSAPRGLPTSFSNHAELIVAVLEASDAASSAHQEAQILADAAAAAEAEARGSRSGGTTGGSGTSSRGGSSSGGTSGGSTGGSSSGSSGVSSPAPHPRAALCERLGFGANGASCLANTPTYVTTNAAYLPLSSCVDPGAYGSHTPGFGGTSSPSYTFPWSYRIDYAPSGLGTVKFFVCDTDD